jgi:hypothetical protein
MSSNLDLSLTRAQLERAWQLTMALAQNEGSQRRSLDMLFIHAARFVERVDGAAERGEVIQLDSGKGDHGTKLMFRVAIT